MAPPLTADTSQISGLVDIAIFSKSFLLLTESVTHVKRTFKISDRAHASTARVVRPK